ncbi:MAG: type II secretion system protein [Lachnospiraceae bacterium]|nr:type II secretion system protein [Lachnospiraceae bacterium]MBQ9610243.1 type II secretion system protein [Lachnospiraceae bacterium]
MKEKLKSNNGFTLIELVIAIAMLAFIMTAVSALMGNSIFSFRKSKANIAVQNKAQSTYDQISDSLMQAQKIVVVGYFCDSGDVQFEGVKSEEVTSGVFNGEYYFVANEAIKKEYNDAGIMNVKLFSEEPKKIYVTKLIIDVAVPFVPGAGDTADELTKVNQLTGETVKIRNYTQKSDGTKLYIKDASGNKMYDTNDIVRYTYTVVDNVLYLEKKYAYGSGDDYTINWSNDSSKLYGEYCDSIKYLKSSTGKSIPGIAVTVDQVNGAMNLELHFDDKDLYYDTQGVIKVRNSNVLENN